MSEQKEPFNWRPFLAELMGTGILLMLGLSLVIFMFGDGAPGGDLIPNHKVRQAVTGFLFGCVGASIAISPLGKVSGAHVNPAVTLGFRLLGKMDMKTTLGYILCQLAGAAIGCLPLLIWGSLGKSIDFGATIPSAQYSTTTVFMGEVITTFILVVMLCFFIAWRKIRKFTPAMIPFLYAIMVPLEADISGTSTNPARSFGPALVSSNWQGWWIYWAGPLAGMLIAVFVASFFAKRIETAKLYHFESDNRRFFREKAKNN
jgi:aquaporin Z